MAAGPDGLRVTQHLFRAGFITAAALTALVWAAAALSPMPELGAFLDRPFSIAVTDRAGSVLFVRPAENGIRREYAPLSRIPDRIQRLFLVSEDRRFALHPGIDPAAVLRSLALNTRAGGIVSGASTITMQLSRLVRPHDRGVSGKIREILFAVRLEARLSKREILELWLNSLPFGYGVEGIQSGSRRFFGKPVENLTDAEAALLAAVPRGPSAYNPVENPDRAEKTARTLLERAGSPEGERELRAALAGASFYEPAHAAPHFTLRLLEETGPYRPFSPRSADTEPVGPARDLTALSDSSGSDPSPAPATGSPLVSSLDLGLNRFAEDLLGMYLERYRESRLTNGAVLVLDNRTGEVLAYVGSRSFFDTGHGGQIDGVRIENQPGSTLKPFIYGYAFDHGYLPNSIVPDVPTDFGTGEVYAPSNFNLRYNGPVRLRVALSSSLNVPAVRLTAELGVERVNRHLVSLGFESLRGMAEAAGPGLALGNAPVTLLELTRAFALFPRGGVLLSERYLAVRREAAAGAGTADRPVRALSAYAAGIVCDILSDRLSRFVGFGAARNFTTPFEAMYKTGTANQFQHIWALGATPRYTAGVWLGNFSGETVVGRTGSSVPLEIAKELLSRLESGRTAAGSVRTGSALPGAAETRTAPSGAAAVGTGAQKGRTGFPAPGDAVEVRICAVSGMALTPDCGSGVTEYLPPGTPLPDCSWHRRVDGKVTVTYPPEYARWAASRGYEPAETDGEAIQPVSGVSGFEITYPLDGAVFFFDPGIPASSQGIVIRYTGAGPVAVSVNGRAAGEGVNGGWYVPLSRGRFTIRLEDGSGAYDTVSFTVR